MVIICFCILCFWGKSCLIFVVVAILIIIVLILIGSLFEGIFLFMIEVMSIFLEFCGYLIGMIFIVIGSFFGIFWDRCLVVFFLLVFMLIMVCGVLVVFSR